MRRVQESRPADADRCARRRGRSFGCRVRDGGQIQDFKSALLLEVPGEIILMHALHDENDARGLFVVRSAQQCGSIPLDGPRPDRLGMGIILLERIVDDHQVAAQPGQGALDRGGVALAAHAWS